MGQVGSFRDKEFLRYPFRKVWNTNMTFDLDLLTWISLGTNIASRDIYLPLLKHNRSSNLLGYLLHNARVYGHADINTYRPTYQATDKNVQSNMPFFERGLNDVAMFRRVVQFTTEKIGALDNVQ